MKKLLITLLYFFIPVIFSIISLVYGDFFYFIIAVISFFISLFITVSNKTLSFSLHLPRITKKTFKDQIKRFNVLFVRKYSTKKLSSNRKTATFRLKNVVFSKPNLGIFVIALLVFSCITIFLLPESTIASPIILQYYSSYLDLATDGRLFIAALLLVAFGGIAGNMFLKLRTYTRASVIKVMSVHSAVYLITLIFSFHLALGIVYGYAAGHVSYITFGHNMGFVPGKVITDIRQLNKTIASLKQMPKVVYYDYPYKKSLVLVKLDTQKGFYGKNIVPNLPDSVYETINAPQASIVMVNDVLLITELKEKSIQELSSTLGKLLVRSSFKNKNIKSDPKIVLLNRQDYLKLREEQINKEVKKLDEGIEEIDGEIGIVYGYVTEGKRQLQEVQDFLANSESRKQSAFNECKTAGEVYEGQFYRYYSDDECNAFLAEWDSIVRQASADQAEIRSTLSHNQQVLGDYQSIRKYITEAREFVDASKQTTPHELGIFFPEDDIKIALDSNNPEVFNAYLSTLVHEYLHYTTYISEERVLDHFFEEALTEYFARKVVRQQLGYSENVGYPVAVKIIEEMVKKVPEDKLLEVYFTKDQEQLEYLLNKAYGRTFYDDSYRFFSTINYLPVEDSLEAANTIMVRIDGKKISRDDVE